jgi:hypothetical protein
MDDETAEIELVSVHAYYIFNLESSQTTARTKPKENPSDFATNDKLVLLPSTVSRSSFYPAILTGFDSRLAKLEKSILPLYTSTKVLNRRASSVLHLVTL